MRFPRLSAAALIAFLALVPGAASAHRGRPIAHARSAAPRGRAMRASLTFGTAPAKAPKAYAAGSSRGRLPVVGVVGVPVVSGVTYFVSASGSDASSGTSPAQAWRTVGRVNRAVLGPGDGVLFEGGQTFGDADLEPSASGTAQSPIVYGSYGPGEAVIAQGAWFVQDHLTFDHLRFGATFYGGSETHGASNAIVVQNCAIAPAAGNQHLGLYGNGRDWVIADNTVQGTGLSGMLLSGSGYRVTGNRIDGVGLYDAGYNAHGIYLDASDATITDNTITNFSESAVSARYRDSTIERNYMSGGQIGIDFYQTDPQAGTSHWQDNTITNTTAAGIYVSSDGAHRLHESFVIRDNSLSPRSGVSTNVRAATTGSYALSGNS